MIQKTILPELSFEHHLQSVGVSWDSLQYSHHSFWMFAGRWVKFDLLRLAVQDPGSYSLLLFSIFFSFSSTNLFVFSPLLLPSSSYFMCVCSCIWLEQYESSLKPVSLCSWSDLMPCINLLAVPSAQGWFVRSFKTERQKNALLLYHESVWHKPDIIH